MGCGVSVSDFSLHTPGESDILPPLEPGESGTREMKLEVS